MSQNLWDEFSTDHRANCLSWAHAPEPKLPPSGTSWRSTWTANPDILTFNGVRYLYYRGNGALAPSETLHDRLGVAELIDSPDGGLEIAFLNDDQPIVDIGPEGSFDSIGALDPAAVEFNGTVYLYYSAIGDGPDSIGLATSTDGVSFTKQGKVLVGRAPEVVERDGKLYLFNQVQVGESYELHVAVSDDGITFEPVSDTPVLTGAADTWDAQSIITPRITRDGDTYFMIYGGSANSLDEPEYFGLARSTDLLTWERHPGNPVFGHGPGGAPDGGALWFPALVEQDGRFVLLYEGSRGKYAWDLSSQICMATHAKAQPAG